MYQHSLPGERAVAVDVVVRGRVQGVGYRASTRLIADRLGVAGWVRNRSDGTVQAHLEGPSGPVEELVRWMGKGPIGGRVDAVEVSDAPPESLTGFDIR